MKPAFLPPSRRLIAHRGYPRLYPENSLAGFKAAITHGARHIECDIQLSADGVPLLLHDATLDRTTGAKGRIFDHSCEALQRLSAHEPARFGKKYAGEPIARLADLAALIENFPGVTAFIEIKSESLEHFARAFVVEKVKAALAGAPSRCVIISFDGDVLAETKRLDATLPIGLVLNRFSPETPRLIESLSPDYIFTHRLLARWHSSFFANAPWQWAVYETSDPQEALLFFGLGAAMVETDDIGTMSDYFIKKTRLEPA